MIQKKKKKKFVPTDIPIIWVNIVEAYSNDSTAAL